MTNAHSGTHMDVEVPLRDQDAFFAGLPAALSAIANLTKSTLVSLGSYHFDFSEGMADCAGHVECPEPGHYHIDFVVVLHRAGEEVTAHSRIRQVVHTTKAGKVITAKMTPASPRGRGLGVIAPVPDLPEEHEGEIP